MPVVSESSEVWRQALPAMSFRSRVISEQRSRLHICKCFASRYNHGLSENSGQVPFLKVTFVSNSSESVDAVKQVIRDAGLRATPARIATLIMLREATAPLTHAYVASQLADSGIDKATAFRNLNDMTDAGLLRRTELGDHVWRFEMITPGGHDQSAHPHFLCIDCGTVSCLDDVKLTAGSQRESGKIGEVTEILLRGHCNDCR